MYSCPNHAYFPAVRLLPREFQASESKARSKRGHPNSLPGPASTPWFERPLILEPLAAQLGARAAQASATHYYTLNNADTLSVQKFLVKKKLGSARLRYCGSRTNFLRGFLV